MSAKYGIGDLVQLPNGDKAIIKHVKEDYYFPGMSPYYLYDVEITSTGALYREMAEPSLTLLKAVAQEQKPVADAKKHDRLCECGAWAVHWAPEQHARWCPAAKWC